ncbi:MAG TPA: NACHT domain-containing protein [Actinophytocola sp.]|uniref:NACHT domain-containing protein n=1 Tax=Actinophytocola sp. TaxID=1872138 RepID=UPI002DDCE162|nr:NACHT domain-containing protein [Actinophytocola sp.]HEV2778725.1 NACHT domain-containing protein [Actinophytocola sp.]
MPFRRWLSVVIPVVCLTAFAIWLVLQFSQGDLDRGDKLASIVSMSVTLFTLPLSVLAIVVTVRQGQPARAVLTLAERLDEMAEALAISVRCQWEAEEQVRRIHDPFPLPVRWSTAPEHLMDHWQTIRGQPHPLVLDGHGDHIVDTFDRIPSGRLVVLGRAGAGKTILTSRFVLTFLATRPLPVPVIFSLGSWDPSTQSLRAWLVDQLIATYPILAERDSSGATVADQLLTTGRVLPVLDGFDEISEGLRVDAINAINLGLRPGDRLLLTSRPDEYAAAVRSGDVLTAAAVVRLEDLTIADLAGYLPLTTRKVHSGRNKWEPVLDYLRAGPSPLSEVLSTPLIVALARAIFSDTNANPTELLGVTSATELEDRLLARFVPAVYSSNRDVSRWFGFLAAHLDRLGTYDLAWWRLVLAVPRVVFAVLSGALLTLATWWTTGLPALLSGMPDALRDTWLRASLAAGLLAGVASGVVVGQFRTLRPAPVRMRFEIRGRLQHLPRAIAQHLRSWRGPIWFAVWALCGLLFGWAAQTISGLAISIPLGIAAGTVIGAGIGLVAMAMRSLSIWVDPTDTVSPAEFLHADRATAQRDGLTFGIGSSTVLWLVTGLAFEPASGMPFAVAYSHGLWALNWLVIAAGGMSIWMLFGTAWGPWLIARFWLALTGRLPWTLMAFLADAHQRGVLRQAGGVYQFRHARLQDHLAAPGEYRPGHSSTPESDPS